MVRNFFKVALRHLQKNRLFAIVNITGLAVGLTSCILMSIYVLHEFSYDRFHKNADRIARVTWHYNFGDAEQKTASTGTKVGPEFARRFPEVETFVRTMKYPRVVKYESRLFEEKGFLYADSAFFGIFSYPLVAGDPRTALDAPDKIVISESMATKYFGNENPVGKRLTVGIKEFQVTGISKNAPDNSQINFDFVASFTSLNASKTEKWNEANYVTYILTRKEGQLPQLQSKINNYMKTVGKTEMQLAPNDFSNYKLEPLTTVHLHSDLEGFEPNNDIIYIYILGVIALLIMIIAGVNYTNLNIAQSAKRVAELSIRKVMGASKKQVFLQFISESLLMIIISFAVAMLLATLLLPFFNQLAGKSFTSETLLNPYLIAGLLIGAVIVTFTAGAYPAFVLSNTKLIALLKSGFSFTGSNSIGKGLIVLQFAIATFLIIATSVILQQLSYIQNKNLGYNKDQVIVLPIDGPILERYTDIKNAIKGIASVESVGAAYEEPTQIGWTDGLHAYEGEKNISVNALPVDEDFTNTLGINTIAGRSFNQTDVKQFDTSDGGRNLRYSFLLNESAVNALGWKPEEAIGKKVAKGYDGIVTGVVKDFHFRSLHETIQPLVIFYDHRMLFSMFVRVKANDIPATLSQLEQTWKHRITHRPFEYHFLDEDYQALYKTEQKTAGVFTTFSSIAIILACLGLFALTAYTMVQRSKEIAIRKILGATISQILTLVSKDFLKLIVIAFVIAVPVAWYSVNEWLKNFSYKINLQWWVFAIGGLLSITIALLTISLQAMKTASENPVKNLRSE